MPAALLEEEKTFPDVLFGFYKKEKIHLQTHRFILGSVPFVSQSRFTSPLYCFDSSFMR